MNKVFLTGGDGFIGKYLQNRLRDKFEIYNLKSDLRDSEGVFAEIKEQDPEFIVHLASRTEVAKSFNEPVSFSDINYTGSVNLFEAAQQNCTKLKLLVFSSTMETYGWQPISDQIKNGDTPTEAVPFDENTPQNPNAPYAVAKVGCEKYLQYLGRTSELPFCILRQTNTYGRYDNDFFVVERIITQMLDGNECNLGAAKPWRNFLFIDDLIDLYEAVLTNPEKANSEVFCTGPNNALSIGDLAKNIAELIGWEGKINWDTAPHRPGEIYYLNSTNQKAQEVLGWSPKVTLPEGLKKTIELWRNNRAKA